MTESPTSRLDELHAEYAEVEMALSDPAVHADQAKARTLGRRFAELAPIIAAANALGGRQRDLEARLPLQQARRDCSGSQTGDGRGRRPNSDRPISGISA